MHYGWDDTVVQKNAQNNQSQNNDYSVWRKGTFLDRGWRVSKFLQLRWHKVNDGREGYMTAMKSIRCKIFPMYKRQPPNS
jgi:hypothetical protein